MLMIPMRPHEIAQAAGARLLNAGTRPAKAISKVSTDTRSMSKGSLFVALKGNRFDGHDFLEQALNKGAAALLVARVEPEVMNRARKKGTAVIRARGTLAALSRLAARQREMSTAEVVGITGSTGKTLTKDFVASVLETEGVVAASRGSFNNEIGVPLTILQLASDTRFLVLEMGSRGMGHVEELCHIARPRIGVITNIGWTHMQYFRTRDNLANAKAELLRCLPRDGTAVINADDDYSEILRGLSPCPVLTFGLSRAADIRAHDIQVDKYGKVVFTLRSKGGGKANISVPLPGRHNVENALAAAAVGKIMGVDMESIAEGIANATTTAWRMEMINRPEEITIINDAYNANPVSMRSALMAMCDISCDKRAIAVLGDMAELGPVSEKAHREVGELAVDYGTDILITVGRKSRKTAQAAREKGLPRGSVFMADGVDKAAEILRAIVEPGDVVLIKGSRFLGLEKLVNLVA
jgi:UDP-N-acetylmuramoyl-tripeptide--D-alanyl-D-alanine ligase